MDEKALEQGCANKIKRKGLCKQTVTCVSFQSGGGGRGVKPKLIPNN